MMPFTEYGTSLKNMRTGFKSAACIFYFPFT